MAKRRAAYSLLEVMGKFPYRGKARRASALLMDLQEGVLTAVVKRPDFLHGSEFIGIPKEAWTDVKLEEFTARSGGSHAVEFMLPTSVIVKAEKDLLEGAMSAISRQEDFALLGPEDWEIPSSLAFAQSVRKGSKSPPKFPVKYVAYLQQAESLRLAFEESNWKNLRLECQKLLDELRRFERRRATLVPMVAAQEVERYLSLIKGDEKPSRSKGGNVGAPKHPCWPDILRLLAERDKAIQGRTGPGSAATWVLSRLKETDKYKKGDSIELNTITKELRRLRDLGPGKILTPDYLRKLLNHPSTTKPPAKPSAKA